MKTLLVKAPEGKGYFLTQQRPNVFVSGRPHVVKNDPQVQMGSARNCIIILGETEMTDEEFAEAYAADPKKAISAAVVDSDEANPAAAKDAVAEAKKAAEQKKATEKAEAERMKAEKAANDKARRAAEAESKAREAAKKNQEGEASEEDKD